MTWEEFRSWATEQYGYTFAWPITTGADWRAIWGDDNALDPGRAGTGRGHFAEYGVREQRRFLVWLRCRHLIASRQLAGWLDAAEQHDHGWLFNAGEGIGWLDDLRPVALQLAQRGFVAIRCGE